MCFTISRLLFIVLICTVLGAHGIAPLHAEELELEEILSAAIVSDTALQSFDTAIFNSLLEYAALRGLTLFELFDDVIIMLTKRDVRARISGDVVRESAHRYELGGRRMRALFPEELIDYFEIGAPHNSAPQLDIYLTEQPPNYFERVNIQIGRNYGFGAVTDRLFEQGFGISAGILVFNFEVERFELYAPREIAIYMRDFERPKRWRISAVKNRDVRSTS